MIERVVDLLETLLHFVEGQVLLHLLQNAVILAVVCYISSIVSYWILELVFRLSHPALKRYGPGVQFPKNTIRQLAHLVPALILRYSAGWLAPTAPLVELVVRRSSLIYIFFLGVLLLDKVISAYIERGLRSKQFRDVAVGAYAQLLRLLLYIFLAVLVFSVIFDRSPWTFISSLGALTAVLLLVFRDVILGFVASVQISANHLVRPGDWIEIAKFGADGEVLDINLTTVRVHNWDRTISTIPTYGLISESFKNWRGMSESGGRRIKRSILIDISSIQFCNEVTLERYRKITLIRDYIDRKAAEIREYNVRADIDESFEANGRRLTNLGTFRAYLVAYLRQHPRVHQGMNLLVRQLQPHEHGLPLEIYCFSREQFWAEYEDVQSDIFDHIIAVAPEFGIRIFQSPKS